MERGSGVPPQGDCLFDYTAGAIVLWIRSASKDLDISSFSFPICVKNIVLIFPTSLRSMIILLL